MWGFFKQTNIANHAKQNKLQSLTLAKKGTASEILSFKLHPDKHM